MYSSHLDALSGETHGREGAVPDSPVRDPPTPNLSPGSGGQEASEREQWSVGGVMDGSVCLNQCSGPPVTEGLPHR